MKKLKKFASGFSIMEVMVATGLLGVVTLGVMQLTKNMTKSTKTQAQQVEFNQIQNQIQSLLKDEYSCEATLLGISPSGSGSDVTEIKRRRPDGSTTVVFRTGEVYGAPTSPIYLKKMAIKNYSPTTGIGDFYIEMNKGRKNYDSMNQAERDTVLATSYGTAVVSRSIKMNLILDSSGNIKDCVSDKDDYTAGACAMLNGDWSDKVKCKSINVMGNGVTPSITAETNLHVKSGLNVGATLTGDPGNGNANLGNDLVVKNNTTITTGRLIFNDGDASIKQVAGNNLYVENKAGTGNANVIVGRLGSPRTSISANSLAINKNGTVGTGLSLEVLGNTNITGSGGSPVTLKVGTADIQYNGSNLVLNKPTGGVIQYKDGSTIEEVASQGFVNAQLGRALTGDSATLSTLLSNLSTLVSGNPIQAISASVCGFYSNMLWNGTRCVDNTSYDCGGGRMLQGLNNGSPNCQPVVFPGQSCPVGQLLTGHDLNGTKTCTNADTQIGGYVDAKVADALADAAANSTCSQKGGWFDKGSGGGRGVCRYSLGCTYGYHNGCHACGGPWGGCPSGWNNSGNDCSYGGSCASWTCCGACHNPNGRKSCYCILSNDGRSCGGDICQGCPS